MTFELSLTPREITLVLVALLLRMTALKNRPEMIDSYNESRDIYIRLFEMRKEATKLYGEQDATAN